MTKDELKKKLDEAEKRIKRLDKGVASLIVQIENEKSEKALLQSRNDDLISKIEDLSDQIKHMKELKEELQEKYREKTDILVNERNELLAKTRKDKVIIDAFVCFAQALDK